MFVVDRATGRDVENVVRIAGEGLSERYGAEEWAAKLASRSFMVARDVPSDEIVGFAVADDDGPLESHLVALAVDKYRQREGVGSALLRGLRDDLARSGRHRLTLEVREDDARAKEFYTRHGFAPEGFVPRAYQDGGNAVRYARPLR